jgi:hypothetical protein
MMSFSNTFNKHIYKSDLEAISKYILTYKQVKKSITIHIQKERVRVFSSKEKSQINAEYTNDKKKKLYT